MKMGNNQSAENEVHEVYRLSQNLNRIDKITHAMDVKAKNQNAIAKDHYKQDKESLQILKSLFKQLDPGVVRTPGEVRGQVELSFKYEFKRQLLLVKIINCCNLYVKDMRTMICNPYVKLRMNPDNHSHGTKTSQTAQGSSNPVFNEIFAFRTSKQELADSQLIIQVWDSDSATQDEFLGEVIINTNTLNFEDNSTYTASYDLKMETDLSVTGDLAVSIVYQFPSTLLVTIHHAHGLSPRMGSQTSDPFVKLAVSGIGAVYSSQIIKSSLDPEWEETFEFEVPQEELSIRHIIFHLIDDGNLQCENYSMGQALFDLEKLDLQNGFHGNLKLADLKNTKEMQNKLTQQVVTREFREAFLAHTAVRCPHFLFQEHTGSKIVRVSCRKAGRKHCIRGQMQIMDGVPVH